VTASTDPAQILAQLFQSGQEFMRQSAAPWASMMPEGHADGGSASANPFDAALQMFSGATTQLGALVDAQRHALESMAAFWSGVVSGTSSADDDRRFAGEAWRKDPRMDVVRRAYLAYADFLKQSVDAVQADDKVKEQLRFSVRQFVDAMSPSNFFLTNPEAAQLALETGGRSVTEGMQLFFEDLAKGRVSMTDENAFEVGKNIGVTAGAVVYENPLIQVIQYTPTTGEVYERPIVMVPPCINKFYIMDLQPENSLIRYAVDQGHTVFMVSWRNVDESLDKLTWDDYLTHGVMAAIDVARGVTGSDTVNTLGFCVGGTLLASALGVMAANGERKAESMTLLTTLLDFSDTGEIGSLVSEPMVAAREAQLAKGGLLRGKELAFVFSSLRANDLIWQYVVNSYLKGKAPPAFDLLYWNSDSTNLPGPMFCWYLRNMYLENRLREPGKTVQCGVPVDLSDIDIPAYVYASREDHIVPWTSAFASRKILGGQTTFLLGASGHIAGVINPPAKKKRNYWVDGFSNDDAEAWLSSAREVPGSWWPHWSEWLARRGGRKIAARAGLGSDTYRIVEPAPGRYVLAKAD
jgi:polyhydroxyalkanoate synthase subunit PhaC